jgi:hypothetical protein
MSCFGCWKNSTSAAPQGNPTAPKAPAVQKAQRAFPFEESCLDVWEMRQFLDGKLGEDKYSLKVGHAVHGVTYLSGRIEGQSR